MSKAAQPSYYRTVGFASSKLIRNSLFYRDVTARLRKILCADNTKRACTRITRSTGKGFLGGVSGCRCAAGPANRDLRSAMANATVSKRNDLKRSARSVTHAIARRSCSLLLFGYLSRPSLKPAPRSEPLHMIAAL